MTLEDPVEIPLEGINQVHINSKVGLTFANTQRSFLRQDPDIIMVGEIRDSETARVAIQAALTGHLVLSTLHTNNAPSAVIRLLDMGVEAFLIKATVAGVLAQRLARKLCVHCRYKDRPNDVEHELIHRLKLTIDHVYHASGCDKCGGLGYKGRIGIFELLIMSPELCFLIQNNADVEAITKQAVLDGMRPLIVDATDKVLDGIISFSEMVRTVVY